MKQTARVISTYASDVSGVCSALFELGGLTVMHDASGCNSTYNTHDEPRWYDFDSLVFISGLTEMEAILGDDQKLIRDIVQAAKELSPRFIAVAGSPIPALTGVDFPALAKQIERKTGIPSFGFPTDGMHSYISGASMALAAIAERICQEDVTKTKEISVNILGLTPLDFSIQGMEKNIRDLLQAHHIQVLSMWAMGSCLEEIQYAGAATVNLVVSACGIQAAKVLEQRFGIPYVVGTPCGTVFTNKVIAALKEAVQTGLSQIVCQPHMNEKTVIIGESVTALSLANALFYETGLGATVLCPVDTAPELLSTGCISAWDEEDLVPYINKAQYIIADPLYQPICPTNSHFVALPHEAFSGRIYRQNIPNLLHHFTKFREEYER